MRVPVVKKDERNYLDIHTNNIYFGEFLIYSEIMTLL